MLAAHVDDAGSDMLQLIAAAAAARLGCLTAVRTLQATAWMSARERGPASLDEAGSGGGDTSAQIDGDLGARRYARLLISEIKMYNEPLVRAGREHRDLSRRLSSEIERARQLYEARVPATLANRAQHFHEELVRTLADGDSTLLG